MFGAVFSRLARGNERFESGEGKDHSYGLQRRGTDSKCDDKIFPLRNGVGRYANFHPGNRVRRFCQNFYGRVPSWAPEVEIAAFWQQKLERLNRDGII